MIESTPLKNSFNKYYDNITFIDGGFIAGLQQIELSLPPKLVSKLTKNSKYVT